MDKMKIIFLDIDGVLNCSHTKDRITGFIGLDNNCLELLKSLVDTTKAKIVLSSSWRHCRDNGMDDTWNILISRLKEFDLEIMDITPTDVLHSYRGFEIQQWFKDNEDLDIESFIILDDDSDLKPYGKRHIQTAYFKNGLEKKHIDKAIKMLNDECKPWFDDTPYWKEVYNAENRQI